MHLSLISNAAMRTLLLSWLTVAICRIALLWSLILLLRADGPNISFLISGFGSNPVIFTLIYILNLPEIVIASLLSPVLPVIRTDVLFSGLILVDSFLPAAIIAAIILESRKKRI